MTMHVEHDPGMWPMGIDSIVKKRSSHSLCTNEQQALFAVLSLGTLKQ